MSKAEFESKLGKVARFPELAESRYFAEYLARLSNGRDMHTIVTAEGETGVGKTMVAFTLSLLLDIWGWSSEKATLDPREYAAMYDSHPPGTWLLGDEWEQAMDSRMSMSKDNRELSHNYAGKRYRQIFSAVTLPSKNWLDKRLGTSSADYWIQCLEGDLGSIKGEARVYRLKEDEHYETSITKKTETLTWPNLDSHAEYKKLTRMKRERFEGTETSVYIHRDEFEDAKDKFWNKASKKTRYELVKAMYDFGLSQTDISKITSKANEVDSISQPRVSQIVNSDKFEDVYTK